jgi:MFS family permease
MAATLCCTTLLTVILMIIASGDEPPALPVIWSGFLLAGLTIPAITTALRSTLALHPGLQGVRLSGYSLLSVTFQGGMAIGPLVVSAVMVVLGPERALAAPVLEVIIAGLLFTGRRLPGDRASGDQVRRDRVRGDQVSGRSDDVAAKRPSASRRLVLVSLMVVNFVLGAAAGLTSVGIPAVAIGAGVASAAGVLFAVAAVGDLVGGTLYGGSRFVKSPVVRQLLLGQIAAVLVAIMVAATIDQPALFGACLLIGGLLAAPVSIGSSALLDRASDGPRIAANYALLVSVGLCGSALGATAAGVLIDGYGTLTPFLIVPMLLIIGLIISAVAFRRIRA